jgi:hypothetical protein
MQGAEGDFGATRWMSPLVENSSCGAGQLCFFPQPVPVFYCEVLLEFSLFWNPDIFTDADLLSRCAAPMYLRGAIPIGWQLINRSFRAAWPGDLPLSCSELCAGTPYRGMLASLFGAFQ